MYAIRSYYESAQMLNQLLHRYFDESQVFRIDHYLGKELWTQGAEGEPIAVYAAFNEVDSYNFV